MKVGLPHLQVPTIALAALLTASCGTAPELRTSPAAPVSPAVELKIEEAQSLADKARVALESAEIEDALEAGEQSIAAWRETGRQDALAEELRWAGQTYSLLGRMDEAFARLRESHSIFRAQGPSKNDWAAGVLALIGWAHHLDGQPEKAIETLKRALRMRGGRPPGMVDRLASVYRDTGRYDEALRTYLECLAALPPDSAVYRATILGNISDLYVQWGKPALALKTLDQAVPELKKGRDIPRWIHALFIRARALRGLGCLDEALAALDKMDTLLESMREGVHRQAFLAAQQTSNHPYQQERLDLLMQLDEQRPGRGYAVRALSFAEHFRGRRLEELRRMSAGAAATTMPPSDERTAALTAGLEEIDKQLQEEVQRDGLSADLEPLGREQSKIIFELDKLRSEARPGNRPPLPPVNWDLIRSRLDSATAVLYFALGPKRSFLWKIDSRGIDSHVLSKGDEIERLAAQCRRLFNRESSPVVDSQRRLHLRRLAQALLGPVGDLSGYARLIVVPEGALESVPFAALPDVDRKALMLGHEVRLLPSAAALGFLKRARSNGHGAFESIAVFVDPVFSRDDPRVSGSHPDPTDPLRAPSNQALFRSTRDLGLQGLRRLGHSRQEGDSIASFFPKAKVFRAVDFQAARATFLRAEWRACDILHVASHSLNNQKHPERSGLVFSLVDPNGRPQPGFVRPTDLESLRIDARLVVLSACTTSSGTEVPGEGTFGLPDAFLRLGAEGVLMTLWRIDDRATAEFMTRFYRALRERSLSPAAALRSAQRSFLEETRWSDPQYWAGFAYIGL